MTATKMSKTDRKALLSKWIQPSSDNEQARQDRAQRMITDAIKAHAPLKTARVRVYAKGSYANNTNVRLDSDVDIVVESHACFYPEFAPGVSPSDGGGSDYEGIWTPATLRAEVLAAIETAFGKPAVTSGSVAITVAEKPGSRPSADVVPCFEHRLYVTSDRSQYHQGTKVFRKDATSLVNWPKQQLNNGKSKNTRTGGRYKNYARALKNAENTLVSEGVIDAKPSYLMECLAWNVPDDALQEGDLDGGFRATLVWLWEHLDDDYVYEDWLEPNDLKYLFFQRQPWTRDDAKELVLEAWRYLGY